MSEIKLFEVGTVVKERTSSTVVLEKQLQTMIEQNMETFFGVRFLKSEYMITSGRMDSIGIDENNSPVIFEYKRSSSENVINQGLFYLDWFDEGGQLSGGQWQKIALARTYYKNADLYLLDEPSSALDVTAETKIFKSFFEVSKNKIAIYITHRVKIAQDANKIIVLDGGKIVGIGTHAELLKNCSVYQDLYNQENLKNKG